MNQMIFLAPTETTFARIIAYKNGAKKANVTVIPSRLSVLTKRINNERGGLFLL